MYVYIHLSLFSEYHKLTQIAYLVVELKRRICQTNLIVYMHF